MAIYQHPRENLLLDATAYTRRCLYRVPRALHWTDHKQTTERCGKRLSDGEQATDPTALMCEWLEPFQRQTEWQMFIGLRADDRWSIYFDEQPVLQFNRQHQLRRLFAGGQRFAANNGQLDRLDRSSQGGQVQLQQVNLDAANQHALLNVCQQFLAEAALALRSGRARRVGEFPRQDTSWLPAFEQNLQRVANDLTIAVRPAH